MEENIEQLIIRYCDGGCTKEERIVVEQFLLEQAMLRPLLKKKSQTRIDRRIRANIREVTGVNLKAGTIRQIWWAYHRVVVAAASILLVCSVSILIFRNNTLPAVAITSKTTIKAGGNKALLTLANGEQLDLSAQVNMRRISQPGASLNVSSNGNVIYLPHGRDVEPYSFNSVETPKGGQWQLVLSDGTKVWLNAASKISYPTVFRNKERIVELKGEAYFEVKRDVNKPFIVNSGSQRLQVLGTHFNISAYLEDKTIKSTLLSGSVKVMDTISHQYQYLTPGTQSVISNGNIRIKNVEASDAIDWQRGLFVFDSEQLGSVTRKLARWYGCKIIFENPADEQIRIGGSISRFSSIEKILEKVSVVGHVRFEIQENEVKVISNH